MTITFIEKWKNPDSTGDLNDRLKYLTEKGLLTGGNVAPTGTGLHVTVNPFGALTQDGALAVSDTVETLTVAAGQVNVVVLVAKYVVGGSPLVYLDVLDEPSYNTDPNKAWMNELCRIDLPPTATTVSASDIDFTQRHEVDVVGRSPFRGIVDFASLPTPTSPTNRVGDIYWVSDHKVLYFWDGSAWEALNTGSYNTETTLQSEQMETRQRLRLGQGSGVIAGTRPGDGSIAASAGIDFIETPTVANSFDLDAFSASVNGHFFQSHARSIVLGSPTDRLDMVFLELWREDIATPELQQYELEDLTTVDIQGIDDIEEKLQWQAGTAGRNYDFYKLEVYDHTFRVVKARFGSIASVPTVGLINPVDPSVSSSATNVDGNPFSTPAGTGSDDRIWYAPSTTSVDGYSWAVPLYIIKRRAAENPGIGDGIKEFVSGERYVFPVYPVADLDVAAKNALSLIESKEPTSPTDADRTTYNEPSGFLSGIHYQIESGSIPNSIRFYDEFAHIRIRGYEEYLQFTSPDIDLGPPPGTGWARTLVFLKFRVTLYNDDVASKPNYAIGRHRPFIKSLLTGDVRGMGYKQAYLNYEVVVEDLGSTNVLDEVDAMLASSYGWARGDLAAPSGYEYEDGGIWSRAALKHSFTETNGNVYGYEWAIPICLVHRRNSTTYDYDTNPNGTGTTRPPDGRQDATIIHPLDLVDLRHEVGITEEDLKSRLHQNMDLLHRGALRTRMANKYLGAGGSGEVAGSGILQADIIGATTGGPWELTPPDGNRTIWSDAKEYQVCSVELDTTTTIVPTDTVEYTYDAPNNRGTLRIKAPPGSFLVRHLPAMLYTPSDPGSSDYLQFYGPPSWTTQILPMVDPSTDPFYLLATSPRPAKGKALTSGAPTQEGNLVCYYYGSLSDFTADYEPFDVIATDSMGRATVMEAHINTSGSDPTLVLSWWVCRDRTFVSLDDYDENYGLAEIPDTVWKVTRDPGGADEPVNVGSLSVVLEKSITSPATTVSFTAADVAAATGLAGTISLVGIDWKNLRHEPSAPSISSITLEDVNQDDITVEYSSAWTGTVQATIFFTTSTVDSWVEIGRAGKSIQALFDWDEISIDLTGSPPSSYYAHSMGGGGVSWRQPQISGIDASACPVFWTRASTTAGTRWELAAVWAYGYPNSNLLTFDTAWLDQYNKVVVCRQKPLGVTEKLLIEYTYTPYQGQSTESGFAPNPALVLYKLKEQLHGVVEEVGDWFVTQGGPASYFSGIETWTGMPVNHPHPGLTANYLWPLQRFVDYNMTALVQDPSSAPSFDLSGLRGRGSNYYAGSVLRLPFPQRPSMLTSTSYHDGVMDFDLDPARAGANSGVLNYAPGYLAGTCYDYQKILYDQFDNGLNPLSGEGGVFEESDNVTITADEWNDKLSTATTTFEAYRIGITGSGSDYLTVWSNLRVKPDSVVKRLQQHLVNDMYPDETAFMLYSHEVRPYIQDGVVGAPLFWCGRQASGRYRPSFIPGFSVGSPVEFFVSIHPGVLHLFANLYWGYNSTVPQTMAIVFPKQSGVVGIAYETSVLAERPLSFDKGRSSMGLASFAYTATFVDLVQYPWSSYSKSSSGTAFVTDGTYSRSTLKGYRVEYPPSWQPTDIVSLEGLIQGSRDVHNRGRGVYLGTASRRYSMPVLVPGSHSSLADITKRENLVLSQDLTGPDHLPTMPGTSLFGDNNRNYMRYSHGGSIAYVGNGMFVNPSSNNYKNQLVLQVSGGPTGIDRSTGINVEQASTSHQLSGTALDSFWPIGRPLLKSKR
jgi:hypothetical protein